MGKDKERRKEISKINSKIIREFLDWLEDSSDESQSPLFEVYSESCIDKVKVSFTQWLDMVKDGMIGKSNMDSMEYKLCCFYRSFMMAKKAKRVELPFHNTSDRVSDAVLFGVARKYDRAKKHKKKFKISEYYAC